ncbi:hypothetical protein [Nonomuraea rubra]|uniref:Uncharacterized protein n=1 Tax=Nonomuraea rubra TaxID=46180 RepID=A0A7X0NPE1_9ACTN|nr:hypothetical protein [Nonomuraea rubra]MBB6546981.1 hypothetical protein [Nonomuraea rubra]
MNADLGGPPPVAPGAVISPIQATTVMPASSAVTGVVLTGKALGGPL